MGVREVRRRLEASDAGRGLLQYVDQQRVRAFGTDADRLDRSWAGDRIGLFFARRVRGAVGYVVPIRDEAKARDDIARLASTGSPRGERYRDVDVTRATVDFPALGRDLAMGTVDGFGIIATPAGFRAAVDALRGDSLAESKAYAAARERAPPGAIALGTLNGSFLALGTTTKAVTVDARFDPRVNGRFAGLVRGLRLGGGPLLDRLPGDSGVAFALSGIGDATRSVRDLAASSGGDDPAARETVDRTLLTAMQRRLSGTLGVSAPLTALRLDDVLSWLGDVGGYGRFGTDGVLALALVVGVTHRDAAARALERMRRALTRRGDRVAGRSEDFTVRGSVPARYSLGSRTLRIAIGEPRRAEDAGPSGPLGRAPFVEQARALLGARFPLSAVAPGAPLARLLRALVLAPGPRGAIDLLDQVSVAALGSRIEGATSSQRLVIGLR